jgi:UDP-N-acetylmuramoyl-tripeptide--D-alanyl-D-alanine ligase
MAARTAPAWQPLYVRHIAFWARLVVRRRRPFVVGITGSVGKTTTKELVAAVLGHPEARATVGEVWATPGNMNNDRSVPLALLGYREPATTAGQMLRRAGTVPLRALRLATFGRYPRVLVLEFAAGPRADLSRTVPLAPPHLAVVTAVGPAHLEHFGTVERVAEAKATLVRLLRPDGEAILGADSELAAEMRHLVPGRAVLVPGRGREFAERVARIVAERLAVVSDVVDRALAERGAVASRMEVIDAGDITVVNDAFNANPLSMSYALDRLGAVAAAGRRRVAILGEMGELGEASRAYHERVGEHAHACAAVVVGVGPASAAYRPHHWFATSDECAAAVSGLVRDGDVVLVKGSNSVQLGTVVRAVVGAATARGGVTRGA